MASGLPILTREQVKELLTESNGRAVSYLDAPEWSIGDRHSTFVMRDGLTYSDAVSLNDGVPEHVCGSMSSLAYSCRDKCRDYLDALRTIAAARREIDDLTPTYNKTKSARRKKDIAQTIRWRQQDITICEEKITKLKSTYFSGFQQRFLIS